MNNSQGSCLGRVLLLTKAFYTVTLTQTGASESDIWV